MLFLPDLQHQCLHLFFPHERLEQCLGFVSL